MPKAKYEVTWPGASGKSVTGPVDGARFRSYLKRDYRKRYGSTPTEDELDYAIDLLKRRANLESLVISSYGW
jgi:hypothetical protein